MNTEYENLILCWFHIVWGHRPDPQIRSFGSKTQKSNLDQRSWHRGVIISFFGHKCPQIMSQSPKVKRPYNSIVNQVVREKKIIRHNCLVFVLLCAFLINWIWVTVNWIKISFLKKKHKKYQKWNLAVGYSWSNQQDHPIQLQSQLLLSLDNLNIFSNPLL